MDSYGNFCKNRKIQKIHCFLLLIMTLKISFSITKIGGTYLNFPIHLTCFVCETDSDHVNGAEFEIILPGYEDISQKELVERI